MHSDGLIGLMFCIFINIHTKNVSNDNVTFAVVYFCESRERFVFFPTLTTRKRIELEAPRFLHHPAAWDIPGAPEEIVRPRDRLVKVGAKPISIFVGWLVGWSVGWLVGWSVGWLVGWLVSKQESPLVGFGVGSFTVQQMVQQLFGLSEVVAVWF